MGNKYEFTPMSQDDFTEELWDAFQNTWRAEAADILEDCTAKAQAAILQAQKSRLWNAGLPWKSCFSQLAYVVRLAYLKGHAAGLEARETLLFTLADKEAPELDTVTAFARCLESDDFADYYFDCDTMPGAATKAFIKAMGKQPPKDT